MRGGKGEKLIEHGNCNPTQLKALLHLYIFFHSYVYLNGAIHLPVQRSLPGDELRPILN
jgi:hypothetical protein